MRPAVREGLPSRVSPPVTRTEPCKSPGVTFTLAAATLRYLEFNEKEITMSVCDEWEELHLTPEGWKDGSYRHEPGAAVIIAPPVNEVLTVRRHVAAVYGGPSRVTEDRTPRTDDMSQIEQLLLKYGAPVFGV
ncbi:hypothetical protein L665_03770 [Ralstonia solanacearum SD54]|nr:hypothetical protein L665_03770 [Ralstonia solanacearum SD54]CAD16410.1 hypothetical protein RSc2703 [Ralstonia pseudosolanacearum GMI1000]